LTGFYQHSENICIHYQKFGSGSKIILAFHGFSKSSEDYRKYESIFGDEYTIIAPDLFYHGKTKFASKEVKSFSKAHLHDILSGWIEHLEIEQFSVLGYSMGGRIALFMLEKFPQKIEKLYLLAPDGIKTNFWNWFVTNTKMGKYIYGASIRNPSIVYGISKVGKKMKILPQKIDKFLDINFGTPGIRLRVYRVWQLYKHIQFKLGDLVNIIEKHQLPVEIVGGKKDPVIPVKVLVDFHRMLPENCRIHLLKAGHDLFRPHVLEYLKKEVIR
jgi:pimeloyl-ACP methyl ester carboxylesterase